MSRVIFFWCLKSKLFRFNNAKNVSIAHERLQKVGTLHDYDSVVSSGRFCPVIYFSASYLE